MLLLLQHVADGAGGTLSEWVEPGGRQNFALDCRSQSNGINNCMGMGDLHRMPVRPIRDKHEHEARIARPHVDGCSTGRHSII